MEGGVTVNIRAVIPRSVAKVGNTLQPAHGVAPSVSGVSECVEAEDDCRTLAPGPPGHLHQAPRTTRTFAAGVQGHQDISNTRTLAPGAQTQQGTTRLDLLW